MFLELCDINDDVNDDVKRVDIGIISNKKMLPFGNWVSR